MNVLFLASWYPENEDSRNGVFIWQHAQAMAGLPQVKVVLAAATASTAHERMHFEQKEIEGVTHWVVRYPAGGTPLVQAWRYFKAWQILRKYYQRQFGAPDAILVNVLWRAGLVARWWKLRFGWKYSILEHWSGYLPNGQGYSGWWQSLFTRWVGRAAEKVAGVSQALVEGLRMHGISNRLMVVPNAVDARVFHPLAGIPRTKHLLHVSNLAPEKNFDFVLEVWQKWRAQHPEAQLWVAGAIDPERMAPYKKLEGLVFLGFLEAYTLADTYRRVHALLLPSSFETFSIVTAEALACGTPVISTPLPALKAFASTGLVQINMHSARWVEHLNLLSGATTTIDASAILDHCSPTHIASLLLQLTHHERH